MFYQQILNLQLMQKLPMKLKMTSLRELKLKEKKKKTSLLMKKPRKKELLKKEEMHKTKLILKLKKLLMLFQ